MHRKQSRLISHWEITLANYTAECTRTQVRSDVSTKSRSSPESCKWKSIKGGGNNIPIRLRQGGVLSEESQAYGADQIWKEHSCDDFDEQGCGNCCYQHKMKVVQEQMEGGFAKTPSYWLIFCLFFKWYWTFLIWDKSSLNILTNQSHSMPAQYTSPTTRSLKTRQLVQLPNLCKQKNKN